MPETPSGFLHLLSAITDDLIPPGRKDKIFAVGQAHNALLTFDIVGRRVDALLANETPEEKFVTAKPDRPLIGKDGPLPVDEKPAVYFQRIRNGTFDYGLEVFDASLTSHTPTRRLYVPQRKMGVRLTVGDTLMSLEVYRFECKGSPLGNDRVDVFRTTLGEKFDLSLNGPAWTDVDQREFANFTGIALSPR